MPEARLRVLMFGRYADRIPGGVQEHVASLCEALGDAAEIVNLVPNRGHLPAHEVTGACEIYRSGSIAEFASVTVSPGMPLRALALHRRHRFQIVHLHFPDPMSHLASMALPHSIPRIISWHSDIVRQRRLLVLYRPFLLRAVRNASAVVAPTPAHFTSSRILRAIDDKSRFRVVPFGFDYARFDAPTPLAAEIRSSAAGRTIVFTVGRHVYYKGLEYLVDAMASLENALLIVGGTGPLTAELRARAARLGLEERVRFVGRIPDDALPAYYQACDVFCLPSVEPSEAFGIVQLEAMACGKPVVACRLDNGVNYVNTDGVTGLVVPPRDPQALARAVGRLAGDAALRDALGDAGRRRAREEYSIERMRSAILAVYREALGSGEGAPR